MIRCILSIYGIKRKKFKEAEALEKRREVNLCDGGRGAYPPSPSVSPPPHKRWKDDAPQSAADLFARAEETLTERPKEGRNEMK